jgi:uncharacterized protein YijF (DUF1287 family)
MDRRPPHYLDTIEYIGPRPDKKPPKRPNFLGGWIVLLIAVGGIYIVGKPFLPLLQAQQVTASSERADQLIAHLQTSPRSGDRLAAAALLRTRFEVAYEDAYYAIDPVNGDIPANKGRAEDLVVRAYRALGVDLQQLVHEDMRSNFTEYPQIFGRKAADSNVDRRLTENLRRFFRRAGAELLVLDSADREVPSRDPEDYRFGDIVTWRLAGGRSHIGIVVPGPGERREDPWVVHNIDSGPVWEDCLLDYNITGHYRFSVDDMKNVTSMVGGGS